MPRWIPPLAAHVYPQWPVLSYPVFRIFLVHCIAEEIIAFLEVETQASQVRKTWDSWACPRLLAMSQVRNFLPFQCLASPTCPTATPPGGRTGTRCAKWLAWDKASWGQGPRSFCSSHLCPNHCHTLLLKEKWAKYVSTSHLDKIICFPS